jgi:hypothetical protein
MRKYGFSFSWKRATGISAMKGRASRRLGIPLTRSGRQRKLGRAAGCVVVLAVCGVALLGLAALLGPAVRWALDTGPEYRAIEHDQL